MTIFLDVDLTLLSENGELRPGVGSLLQRLKADGHRAYLWSGNGIRWGFVDRFGLRELVAGCLYKPLYDVRAALRRQGVPPPDFCVDDYPEFVDEFGGLLVSSYGLENAADCEMERVYEAVREWAARAEAPQRAEARATNLSSSRCRR